MATTTADLGLTRAQLIEVVRTGSEIKGVARMRALAALQHRERKDVGEVLLEVVADRKQAPRFRYMAAMGLYRMGGDRARDALVTASARADASSAPALAVGLGRLGSADSLSVIERLERIAPTYARDRAQFAETLLTYRHRLAGRDVKAPVGKALQEVGRQASRPIETRRARADEAKRAMEALRVEPLDVDLTSDRAIRIDCEPNTFLWLWTKETATGGFASLVERKGVAGVLFRKRLFENAYALSAIGLATPMRQGVRLTVHRAETGAVIYAGTVAVDGTVELKARARPGLPAIDVAAPVEAGSGEVTTARSAVVSRNAKTPKRS